MSNFANDFEKYLYSKVGRAMYTWGGNGEIMTPAKIKSMETSADNYNRALKTYNKLLAAGIDPVHGFDCSGLPSRYMQDNGLVPSKRNCNHLAKTYCEHIYERSKGTMQPLDLVFWRNATKPYYHVGVYMGHNMLIESRGRDYGVVTSNASSRDWDCWGRLKILTAQDVDIVILQAGDTGAEVVNLQTILMALGYALPKYGADGSYGAETTAAVKALQEDNELPATGIVDEATWAALTEAQPDDGKGICTGGSVYVRSGPGTQHSKLGVAHAGDTLRILSRQDGWCAIEITLNGVIVSGYMSAKYVEV